MTLATISKILELTSLDLNYSKDAEGKFSVSVDKETGEETKWLRHWDNERRLAVSISEPLALELGKNPGITSLGLQSKEMVAKDSKETYTAYRIVKIQN
ncbi:hypothetical protein [Tenacibaculum piscium]|uniref:hypothetical protein n=1 Tax=Tenacibaculum piscium TaxID=1458515 RepID=UPI00187B7CE5|nr:hypothetical protein [Tenacibaculum piscium]MBE7691249.1 hypothetical protein [Tenacibaculum piscium]